MPGLRPGATKSTSAPAVWSSDGAGGAVLENGAGGLVENLPDAIHPLVMLGLHQDGAEAGDCFPVALDFGGGKVEEMCRKLG